MPPTHRFRLVLPLVLFTLVTMAHAQAPRVVDTTIIADDGIRLDAIYGHPGSTPPAEGFPGIVFVHGFNGSKNDMRSYVQNFAAAGYATATYSVRGQGNSQGVFSMFTAPRVLDDLRNVIAFVAALPHVRADRIGVAGASQGGIHAWAAAAFGMPVRCVVSIVANGRFEEDWCADNALNWLFSNAIQYSNVRFDSFVKDTVRPALIAGDTPLILPTLTRYSTTALETGVTIPTLIMVSYYDQFFNPSSALRQFASIAGPKRIVLYPGTHASPTQPQIRAEFERLYRAWLDHWLKGVTAEGDVASPDSAVVMIDAATNVPVVLTLDDAGVWGSASVDADPRLSRLRLHFTADGALTAQAPAAEGRTTTAYAQGVGSAAMIFRSAPFAEATTVAGIQGTATLTLNGSGSTYQAALTAFDVNPADNSSKPLTRGHVQVTPNGAGRERVTFRLNACMHTIAAGHIIEIRVHGGLGFIPNTTYDFGNAVSGPVANSSDTLFTGGDASFIDLVRFEPGSPVSVSHGLTPPADPQIGVNHPNPFPTGAWTMVPVQTVGPHARLIVVDALGRRVYERPAGSIPAGSVSVRIPTDGFHPGLHIAILQDGGTRVTRSMLCIGQR